MKTFAHNQSTSARRVQRLAKAGGCLNLSATFSSTSRQQQHAAVLSVTPVDVRLAMNANPDKGEVVTVSIQTGVGESDVCINGIVHWTEMRGAEHEVGIFLTQLLPERLRHLHTDQRQSERYRCRIPGQINWGNRHPESQATIVNYSFDGMAVQSPVAGNVDEVFTFAWTDQSGSSSLNGAAMWQIEQNGGFLIGCQLEPGSGYRIARLRMPGSLES